MKQLSKFWPSMALIAALTFAVAGRADESSVTPMKPSIRNHGMMNMMSSMTGMTDMTAGCERMMQMSDQPQSAPNEQWRHNPKNPQSGSR